MLESLLKYTALADQKIIEIFRQRPDAGDQAILLFSHILNAQHIWAHRMLYTIPQFERMQVHSHDRLSGISERNTEALRLIFDTLPSDQEINYSNSDGSRFINTVEEILYHIVNHSTYHRGQVASQFRQNGLNPPVTDFIVLKRNGEL